MAFAGLRGTGDWATDERPKNFRETILRLNPAGDAVITAIMAKAKSEKVDDPDFSWFEEENNVIRVQMDATGASATSTAFGLVSGGLSLVTGDVLMVEKTETATYDNELVLVTTITNDTTIAVVRGQAGSSGAATGPSAWLTKIGNVFSEGSASPNVSSRNPTKVNNLCQIFKTAYEITETAKHTKARTGDPLQNDRIRKMFDHSSALEYAFMFGQKFETTGDNGKPLRYTAGLRELITSNVTIFTTSPTEDTFLDAISPCFNYSTGGQNSSERLLIAGNGFLNNMNKIARDSSSTQIHFDKAIQGLYGMKLRRWVFPQGEVYVKTHPLMSNHARFTNSAFVLNGAGMIYRYLRDTKDQRNIQNNDEDTEKGQWLSEIGLELQHEKTFGYIGNFVK